ncbi:polysaccharide deacetylase family protein [Eubacterium multiforme]|uniref:Peptidoglycan/xylan/chitin deacetylase (PgdA/CDA1 family) n=1 Tax=Eubacterium multiforme TaxID=83339 RepID=A0ABT9UX90_9FIRM|nr:polysaccharide deacetylase family protein [Eubacterium multiforme]MDQ0150933.1 peptidoglycan/xylan/chitin deacetylase (PgdA/CDA1 family) [Eubacterium multiforme]
MEMNGKNNRRSEKRRKAKKRRIITGVILVVLLVSGVGIYAYAHHKNSSNSQVTEQKAKGKTGENGTSAAEEQPKPTDIMKGQNIINSANSYAVPANDVLKMMQSKKPINNEKEVFLTFDDGPSENTSNILKILKEENVHATFFVLGSQLKNNPENQKLLKDEIDSGNAIANHTFSHEYRKLYPGNSVNVKVFMNEINENNEQMKNILGPNFDSRVLRMPGGYMSRAYYHDPHLKQLNEAFRKEGIISIDWDAETGDAESNTYSVEHLVSKAKFYMEREDHVVLLMHDAAAKKSTVKALPQVIKMFKDNGYKFKVIKNAPMSYFEKSNNTSGNKPANNNSTGSSTNNNK